MVWILLHEGIEVNETVNKLAKAATQKGMQIIMRLHYSGSEEQMKNKMKVKTNKILKNFQNVNLSNRGSMTSRALDTI